MPTAKPLSVPARPEMRVAPHVRAAHIRAAQAKLPEPSRTAQRAAPPPLHMPHAAVPPRVLQRAAAAAAAPAAAPAVTTLTSAEVVTSFEAEVKSWPYGKYKYNTGHGGPTATGKTRTDVQTAKADFDTAVNTLKAKTYKTPRGADLKYYHAADSSQGSGICDIVFSGDAKSPGDFGVESINYHIKTV
jgi:hypothetical protein